MFGNDKHMTMYSSLIAIIRLNSDQYQKSWAKLYFRVNDLLFYIIEVIMLEDLFFLLSAKYGTPIQACVFPVFKALIKLCMVYVDIM